MRKILWKLIILGFADTSCGLRLLFGAGLLCCLIAVPFAGTAHAQKDVKGSSDPGLFPSRMPGYFIYTYEPLGFSVHEFRTRPGKKIEGKYTRLQYLLKKDQPNPGDLAIRRNYQNAIRSAGGEVVYADDYISVFKAMRNGVEVWAEVETRPGSPQYILHVVEREEMQQVITADAMGSAIDKDGFIALDIHFATGKADILPESKPTVDEIVMLLKKRPSLRVGVEGHTDNTGSAAANKALSQARAKSVAAAISGAGISTNRLEPVGYGQERPIADNRLADGRARNRRVEIVKR